MTQTVEDAAGDALLSSDDILQARDITVEYKRRGAEPVVAVDGLTLGLRRGETLGLVGESGCGKSTTGRALVQLPTPTSGSVRLEGVELTRLSGRELRQLRRRFQLLFQDPISSLNPRRTAQDIVAEPLRVAGVRDAEERALSALLEVGVDSAMAKRRPHQLSGGQCQRISIARAMALQPEVLICDEPVSALDVSVQAQVLNLLETMKAKHGLSMVFVSHDLAVVKNISDRVAVMYLGRLCEVSPAADLYRRPRHHYTALLLSSIPNPDRSAPLAAPQLPDAAVAAPPSRSGCLFAPRCPAATDLCHSERPALREMEPAHFIACHHPVELDGDHSSRNQDLGSVAGPDQP